jgi:NADH-quinone oxidoreductase subunit F
MIYGERTRDARSDSAPYRTGGRVKPRLSPRRGFTASWHDCPMGRREVVLPERPVESLDEWFAAGGGEGLARAKELGAEATIAELARSGLRGRGGAGFPIATKWRSVRRAAGRHRYAVCNGAEGEPGTFKDRAILRANPYQVVEGLAIAALSLEAREVFIALKASFGPERERVLAAVTEMEQAGLVGDLSIGVVAGPEEYLFGEEKALLEVIEGNEPLPRWLPPYVHGLFATAPQLGWQAHEPEAGHSRGHESNPTAVNNVETLADVAHIMAKGAEWYRTLGTTASPGTVVCTVVGDTERAGVVEVESGTPLREVLTAFGAPRPGRAIRAVLAGVTNSVLAESQLDTPLTFEAFAAAGSGLGAAGFIVYDDTACMVDVAAVLSRFLWVESCGQCPPCKLGTGAITSALDDIAAGVGTDDSLENIEHWLGVVADGNRCFLPVEEQQLVGSILRAFPGDFETHLRGPCTRPHRAIVPKLVDIADGRALFDEEQMRKRPDWTYEA